MDIEKAIDDLYAGPLEDFVTTRNTLAKQAKSLGESQTSSRIKALRKPTVAAWLSNLAAHVFTHDLQALASLGDQMREATTARDGVKLRELTAERRQMVDALVAKTVERASERGQRVSAANDDALRETLLAAVADPQAAEAILAGRLTHALQHVGFGVIDETGAPADVISLAEARARRSTATTPAPSPEKSKDDHDQQKRTAELAEAKAEKLATEQLVTKLTAKLDESTSNLEARKESVERLTLELDAAQIEVDRARELVEQLQSDLKTAQEKAEHASQRLDKAQNAAHR